MDITVSNNILKVSPEGRLDIKSVPELESAVNEKLSIDIKKVEFDFKNVKFISSYGLRFLISVYKTLETKDVTILNPNDTVFEIFKISGLDKFIKIVKV